MFGRIASKARTNSGTASLAVLCALSLGVGGAYAARVVRHSRVHRHALPAPSIKAKPTRVTPKTSARFTFTDRHRGVTFQCALDKSRFVKCASPITYWRAVTKVKTRCHRAPKHSRHAASRCRRVRVRVAGRPLAAGSHVFRVRARARTGAVSRAARYTWTVIGAATPPSSAPAEAATGSGTSVSPATVPASGSNVAAGTPERFTITGRPEAPLFPGAPAEVVPLTISNPNPVPIFVTGLTVTAAEGTPACPSAANLQISQSDASVATPVQVPANGSVTLPAQGVSDPQIQLLDLEAVNQDGCQGVTFALDYTGVAHS
jgi:hypothetical protein